MAAAWRRGGSAVPFDLRPLACVIPLQDLDAHVGRTAEVALDQRHEIEQRGDPGSARGGAHVRTGEMMMRNASSRS
jgi:hypothetical protein